MVTIKEQPAKILKTTTIALISEESLQVFPSTGLYNYTMNMINKMSKRHHEYRIAYIRHKLSSIAHGFFSTFRGRPVVCIFYDPNNPKINSDHKGRYGVFSNKGKIYSDQVNQYLPLKAELDALLKNWRSKYIMPPRDITFPLKKKRKDILNKEWFDASEEHQNPYENDYHIDYKGHKLRSKNEQIAYQLIDGMGYDQKSEIHLKFRQFDGFYPDDTFYVPEIDKVFILGIEGAIDKPDYASKSHRETVMCITNGLVEMKDFIMLRLPDARTIDSSQIEVLIRAAIEASIDDIVGEP